MTRVSKMKDERNVLNFFLEKVEGYKQFSFMKSEQPDFIDLDNNCGIEITEFHNFEIKRQIEFKLNDSIRKAKEKFFKINKTYINVYLHFNFNFLRRLETGRDKYFDNQFSNDLMLLCNKLIETGKVEVSSPDIRLLNCDLSKVLTYIAIDFVDECGFYRGWQMIRAHEACINEEAVKAIVRKKEKLLNQYKRKNSQISKYVLLINANTAPVIGLENYEKFYSTTGSLKHLNDIKHIKSLFDEVYLLNINQNKVVSNI